MGLLSSIGQKFGLARNYILPNYFDIGWKMRTYTSEDSLLVSSKGVPTLLLFFDIRKYFLKKMQKKCKFLQNVRFIWQKHNKQTPPKLGWEEHGFLGLQVLGDIFLTIFPKFPTILFAKIHKFPAIYFLKIHNSPTILSLDSPPVLRNTIMKAILSRFYEQNNLHAFKQIFLYQ